MMSLMICYDPSHLLKNLHNKLKKLEKNVASCYCSDSVLLIRMAPKLTQKHVDLPVFSRRVEGWTQGQHWCHTIPYSLLTDHGDILNRSDLSNSSPIQ